MGGKENRTRGAVVGGATGAMVANALGSAMMINGLRNGGTAPLTTKERRKMEDEESPL